MIDYKRDSDNDIEDNNEKVNHSDNNNKDDMQYIMAVYLFNKSFIYFLMAHNTLLSNKNSIAQYFVFNQYIKMVFQGIMPYTGTIKVSIARNSQFRAL